MERTARKYRVHLRLKECSPKAYPLGIRNVDRSYRPKDAPNLPPGQGFFHFHTFFPASCWKKSMEVEETLSWRQVWRVFWSVRAIHISNPKRIGFWRAFFKSKVDSIFPSCSFHRILIRFLSMSR